MKKKIEQPYNYEYEVMKHKKLVSDFMLVFVKILLFRASIYDNSKFEEPEYSIFKKFHPMLRSVPYMSDEYKRVLKLMRKGVNRHQKLNDHHPEHYKKNSVNNMNLFSLMEMVCDWLGAQKRQNKGILTYKQMRKNICQNCERYNIDDNLKQILLNTIKELFNETKTKKCKCK